MSWLDKIKTDLIIQCGDGKQFRPQWLNASKSKEYNVAEFEFPNVSGTLVHRSLPKGRRYNLELYFQGENHLDITQDFELSADDKRAWVLTHPMYGRLNVQPLSLSFDNTEHNVTKITGTVVETISEDYPKGVTAPQELIDAFHNEANEALLTSLTSLTIDTAGATQLDAINKKAYTDGVKFINAEMFEDYFNAFNEANAAITNATSQPLQAMRLLQAVLLKPAQFRESVQSRMNTLVNQFNSLRANLGFLTTPSLKQQYEANAGATISGLFFAVSMPMDGDYQKRSDVLDVVDTILYVYNTYVSDLDSLQTDNNGSPTSYVPSFGGLLSLGQLVNFTLSNLFDIAINAKQERTLIVDTDTNLVLLTHRIYGLDATDANIEYLKQTNGIGLNEILQIRKNRKILYYV